MTRTAVFFTQMLAITSGLSGEEADRDKLNLTVDHGHADLTLPDGFAGTVFAEPNLLKQPIAMAFDDRGRLWVAETVAYQNNGRSRFKDGRDRIVILEDQDGDGVHDKRTIFHEKLNRISAIAIGFGGVWVGATPYLYFIPDRDGDDKPDGKPEAVLDGVRAFGVIARPLLGYDQLEGYSPLDRRVVRAVDHGRGTRADSFGDLVAPDPPPRRESLCA